jgi:hypothetical protein
MHKPSTAAEVMKDLGHKLQRLGWDPFVVQYMFQKVLFDEMETYLVDRYGQDPLFQSPAQRAEAVQRVSIVRPLLCELREAVER